jgi:hypothetical protein
VSIADELKSDEPVSARLQAVIDETCKRIRAAAGTRRYKVRLRALKSKELSDG